MFSDAIRRSAKQKFLERHVFLCNQIMRVACEVLCKRGEKKKKASKKKTNPGKLGEKKEKTKREKKKKGGEIR